MAARWCSGEAETADEGTSDHGKGINGFAAL
jgi:hypothetical protein